MKNTMFWNWMRILAILIILAGMGVMPYQEPVHHVFTMDYQTEIARQAHAYHGIRSSDWWLRGEPTFMRQDQRCNLITTIKRWEVVL